MKGNRGLRTLALVVGLAVGLPCSTAVFSAAKAHALGCDAFAYQGKPIHPALVQEFEPLISDDVPPITVRLNVSAAEGTNEYMGAPQEARHGAIGYEHGRTRFAYRVVGCANGTYALRTFASSGGSGIFQSLLLVRMSRERAYDANGISRSWQRFLTIQRRLVLGDRDTAEISVDGSTLTIGTSRYRDRVLRIDLGESNGGSSNDE